MRIRLPHIPYISRKIAIDMLNSGFITFSSGIESVAQVADEILREDVNKERALDEKADEVLESKSEDMHIMQVDKKSMFWLVKKRFAEESGFILNREDRYSSLSYKILEVSWKRNLIDYKVSENRAKNIIYLAIESYLNSYEDIEDVVIEKIEGLSRKLMPGTDEYDLTFEKYYEEELKKRGMF